MPQYQIARVDRYDFRKALSTNSTENAYSARVPTTTKPTSLVGCEQPGGGVASKLVVMPFGSDANNEAFGLRIYAWRMLDLSGTTLWVPANLAEFTCTLGNIAATSLGANNFICDTVAKVGTIPHADVYSTTDTPGHTVIQLLGFSFIEFQVDIDSAASGNAMYAFI